MTTGYTSYFAIYWQNAEDISLTSGLHILSIYSTMDNMSQKLLPWSQVVYRVLE